MFDAMRPMELQPKDILQFMENRAERALEVLREIIDVPEYDNAQLTQAMAIPNQVLGGLGTAIGWGNTATTFATPIMVQEGTANV